MNWQIAGIVAFVLAVVTILGFLAVSWRRGNRDPLQEWSLGGRRFGVVVSWCLLGGTIFSANTFIAIPGLVFGVGAQGFYIVTYQTLIYPLAFLVFSRFWIIARHRGYLTVADFVKERFGRTLALMIAFTGILATMPYLALQLFGLEVVIAQLGVPVELSLLTAFGLLSLYTYVSGLRAAILIAIIKDVMLWLIIPIALFTLVSRLGGFEHIFAAVHQKALRSPSTFHEILSPAQYSTYLTLVLASAPAIILYPHTITAALSSRSHKELKLSTILLLAFVLLLSMTVLLGFIAIAMGIKPSAPYQANSILPSLFIQAFPSWFGGLALATLMVCSFVPAALMSIGAANLFSRNVYREYIHPSCSPQAEFNVARITSLLIKFGALLFILFLPNTFATNFQQLGGVWILQTLPAVMLGLYTKWFHQRALIIGWIVGMGLGTLLAILHNFTSQVHAIPINGVAVPVYIGLIALVVNLLLSTLLTPIFRSMGLSSVQDTTTPTDFEAQPVIDFKSTGVMTAPRIAAPTSLDFQPTFQLNLRSNRYISQDGTGFQTQPRQVSTHER
jgi:SSS family solute:Na+ symporter